MPENHPDRPETPTSNPSPFTRRRLLGGAAAGGAALASLAFSTTSRRLSRRPWLAPDEFVAGNSPAGTVGAGLPVGPGFRVPCIVISPWTAGGWVFSEPSDHTSHLMFLEQVTGVPAPNISAYRRQNLSEMTRAFRFDSHAEPPVLPDTSGPLTVANYTSSQFPLPPYPGADQAPPFQPGATARTSGKTLFIRNGPW